jgi:hypothetical protein
MVALRLEHAHAFKGLFRTFLRVTRRLFGHFLGLGRYRRIVDTATPQFVELRACGSDDPDGTRTAVVLSAYFHAEHVRVFCRLLWRRLGAVAAVWLLIAMTTSLLSPGATVTGFTMLGGLACWAAVIDWKASNRVRGLLTDIRACSTVATSVAHSDSRETDPSGILAKRDYPVAVGRDK